MPFCLINDTSTSQRIMNIILSSVKCQFAMSTSTIKSYLSERHRNSSTIPYLFRTFLKRLASLSKWKLCILQELDLQSWSRSPSRSASSHRFHYWRYTRLKYTDNTFRVMLIHFFVQCIWLVRFGSCLHRVIICNETAQVTGKRAWRIKWRGADRLADVTEEA